MLNVNSGERSAAGPVACRMDNNNFDKQVLLRLKNDDTELILTKDGQVIVGTEQGYFTKDDFLRYIDNEPVSPAAQPWQAWERTR